VQPFATFYATKNICLIFTGPLITHLPDDLTEYRGNSSKRLPGGG
ncbi:uncharacterized protein METZ01_LOCUS466385, partial [marine metagenome]